MKYSEKFKEKLMKDFMHIFSDILYKLDWRRPNKESVKKFLNDNVIKAYEYKNQGILPVYKGTQDQIALKSLNYVINNVTYKTDKVKWNSPEVWEDLTNVIERWYINEGTGLKLVGAGYKKPKNYPNSFRCCDCESGSLLLYCLLIVNGINPLQVKFLAGDVVGGGHAWIEYAPTEMYDYTNQKQNWYTMDWCYYPDTLPFNKRTKKSSRYIRAWFELNHMMVE